MSALAFAGMQLPAWAADTSVPILNSFSISSTAVTPGDELTYSYNATDEADSLASITVSTFDEFGTARFLSIKNAPLVGAITVTVPDAWPDGDYILGPVYLQDPSGNTGVYWRFGSVTHDPSSASGPQSHGLDFREGDFTVQGSSADYLPPELNSFGISTPSAMPGDTITFSYDVDDDGEYLKNVWVAYEDPVGEWRYFSLHNGHYPTAGTISVRVPDGWRDGLYQLREVSFQDPSDFTRAYSRNGDAGTIPSALEGPTRHSFDLSTADFTISGAATDNEAPVLYSFSLSDRHAAPGDDLTVSYRIGDVSGDVIQIIFAFVNPTGKTEYIQEGGYKLAPEGTITFQIPDSWPPGNYELSYVMVHDSSDSTVYYERTGSALPYPSGITGTREHSMNLSTADFAVVDATTDASVPTLSDVSVAETQPSPGDDLALSFDATDDSGAIDWIEFWFLDPNGRSRFARSVNGPSDSPGTLTVTIPDDWPEGDYQLTSVGVRDAVSNVAYYRRDGSVTTYPAEASGPTEHSVDLSAADFHLTSDTPPPPPSAPNNVTAVQDGARSVLVSWDPATANGSKVTGYQVFSSPAGHTCSTSGTTECSVTGLVAGITYTFTVVASSDGDRSASSDPSNSVTAADAPDQVRHLRSVVRPRAVIIRWRAPLNDGGARVTAYRVVVDGKVRLVAADALSKRIRRLAPGEHTVRVAAGNVAGWGRVRRWTFTV